METSFVLRIQLLAILCTPIVAWSQSVSLDGIVTDKFSQSPIVGAQIIIGKRTLGISGAGGKYSVALNKHGKMSVLYRQIGYADHSDDLLISGPEKHDVELIKNTTSILYWKGAAHSVQSNALGTGRGDTAALTWGEIDSSNLSPEAKAIAAQQLFPVFPSAAKAPETLKGYKTVDLTTIKKSSKSFDDSLDGSLPSCDATSNPPQLPANVAADVAAERVVNYEKSQNKTVPQDFYDCFLHNYGSAAGARLKHQVNKIDTPPDSTTKEPFDVPTRPGGL